MKTSDELKEQLTTELLPMTYYREKAYELVGVKEPLIDWEAGTARWGKWKLTVQLAGVYDYSTSTWSWPKENETYGTLVVRDYLLNDLNAVMQSDWKGEIPELREEIIEGVSFGQARGLATIIGSLTQAMLVVEWNRSGVFMILRSKKLEDELLEHAVDTDMLHSVVWSVSKDYDDAVTSARDAFLSFCGWASFDVDEYAPNKFLATHQNDREQKMWVHFHEDGVLDGCWDFDPIELESDAEPPDEETLEQMRTEAEDAREAFAATLGNVSPYALTPAINSAFSGGPMWPGLSQSWLTIERKHGLAFLSNGLSNPSQDDKELGSGLGFEVLVESTDLVFDTLADSWLLQLSMRVCNDLVDLQVTQETFEAHKILSFEIFSNDIALKHLQSERGSIGVLLSPPSDKSIPRQWKASNQPITLITAKLLTPDELQYAIQNGAKGKKFLWDRFKETGSFHFSSLDRKSVLHS